MNTVNLNSCNLFTELLGIRRRSVKLKDNLGKFFATNRDGLVQVVGITANKNVTVRFIDTGTERDVNIDNLRKGKCADPSITDRTHPTTYPNIEMQSNNSGVFTILEKTGNRCKIVFKETGYTTTAYLENLKVGKVHDPYSKNCYSVGYHGEPAETPYKDFAYTLWRNMLKRCYSQNDPRGYYGKGNDVSVDERWLSFANFVDDLPHLNNFQQWLNGQMDKTSVQFNLDKDFAYLGCNVYSRDNCQFLEEGLNKRVTSKNRLSKSLIENYNKRKESCGK